jgi:hypothetical protein
MYNLVSTTYVSFYNLIFYMSFYNLVFYKMSFYNLVFYMSFYNLVFYMSFYNLVFYKMSFYNLVFLHVVLQLGFLQNVVLHTTWFSTSKRSTASLTPSHIASSPVELFSSAALSYETCPPPSPSLSPSHLSSPTQWKLNGGKPLRRRSRERRG